MFFVFFKRNLKTPWISSVLGGDLGAQRADLDALRQDLGALGMDLGALGMALMLVLGVHQPEHHKNH